MNVGGRLFPRRSVAICNKKPLFGAKRAAGSLSLKRGSQPCNHFFRSLNMLDWMLPEKHAISILKKDHDTVKELFDRFEKTDAPAENENIIARAVMELKI